MAITKHIYRCRVVDGVCVRCGVNPPKEDKLTCQDCLDYLKKYNREHYKPKPDAQPYFRATGKAKTNAQICLEKRERRMAKGLCIACGKEPVELFLTCVKCRKHNADYRKNRKANESSRSHC